MADNQTINPSLPKGFLAGAEGEIIKSNTPKMAGQTAADMAEQAEVSQGDVMAEQAKNPELNPDAVVGNILTRAAQKPGPEQMSSTSDASKAATEAVGTQIDSATEKLTGGTPSEEKSKVTLSEQSQAAYDRSFDLLDSMAATAAADRKTAVENIEKQRDLSVAKTERSQRMESGAVSKSLARIGAYGGTGSGIAYAQSLASSHRIEAEGIKAKWAEAIEKAKAAYDQKDIELANQLMNTAASYETQLNNARTTALNEARFAMEVQKYKDQTDAMTLDALASSGKSLSDIPPSYFDSIDTENKWKTGTSKALFEVSANEKALKETVDAQEAATKRIAQAAALQSVLKSIPSGQPVTIDGTTYYGTSGLGDIEVDETTGEASVFTVGADGKITQKYIGNVGAAKDGWSMEMIGGEPFSFNSMTGEYRSFLGPKAELNDIIPVGVYDSMPGKADAFPGLPLQCGEFTSTLTGQLVGSTLAEKMAKIDVENVEDIMEGNTIVFGGSSTGHVAVVNGTYTVGGRLKFVLSEANWKSPGEVTHDREIYADDPSIKGAISSSFKPEYVTGPDSGRLEAAIARENAPKATKEVTSSDGVWEGLTTQDSVNIRSYITKFSSEPITKRYSVIAEGNDFIQSLVNKEERTSADDQGLLYAFAKALDPESVVREGEYATVQKYSQSWAEQFGFKAKRIFSNEPFLTDEARKNMASTIKTKYNSAEKSYRNVYDSAVKNINNITGREDGSAFLTDYSNPYREETDGEDQYSQYRSQVETGEVLIMRDGQIGVVPEGEFNSSTDTRL